MAVLYGADRELAEKDMKEALEFESGMANVRMTVKSNIILKYSSNLVADFFDN